MPLRATDGGRPNVLLVTVDTLRADHLGAWGYPLPTSPAIDALAAEGVRFTNAYTPVPTTAPALASLLTGVHLDAHGVRANGAALPDHLTTIGEAFAAAGYETGGFFGNGAIQNGFGQGLRVWEPFAPTYMFNDAAGATRAIAWIEAAARPWFLWVHFMDPHGPYSSSPPRRSAHLRYPADPALDRRLEVAQANSVRDHIPKYQALSGLDRVGDYVRRYDGEIIGTDEQVLRLRRALDERGLLDDTLLVLTADHGESLGEDGWFFQHGTELNEASLHVPLVLRHPGLPAGRRVEAPVSLLDLFPTLASLAGLPPPRGVAGRDLAPLVFGAEAAPRTLLAYAVTVPRAAVRRGPWKLVGRVPVEQSGGDQPRLSRTGGGREEPVPAADHPEVVARLERELARLAPHARAAVPAKTDLTPEDRERLRALGYAE